MKLQNRLMLSLTLVTAIVLGLSLAGLYVLVQRDEVEAFDLALFQQASVAAREVLSDGVQQLLLSDGGALVPELLTPTSRYLVVYDLDGQITAASKIFFGKAPTLDKLGIETRESLPWQGVPMNLQVGTKALRGVVLPFGIDGQSLLFAASRHSITEDLRFLNRVLTLLFFGAMMVTALFSRWLGGVLARDVGAIAQVARAVTHGDLDARVGVQATNSQETRALAGDLDEMVARLAELVRTQQSFVSHAAHELRSPLATLRGELQFALRRPREPEEYQRSLEMILEDVDALARLSEDLLSLARIQDKHGGGQSEVVRASDLVGDATKMARGLSAARGVSIVAELADERVSQTCVRGRRHELVRVLRNLIDNASQHGPSQGEVRISCALVNAGLEISVTDQGEGISESDRTKIFAPFFRGAKSQSGDQEGSGLGLSIARGIARAHGGEVEYDASHSPGARFVLKLPVVA